MIHILIVLTHAIAGLIMLICGFVGVFFPELVADHYGFIYELPQAKTTMRVLAGLFVSSGLIFLVAVFRCRNQSGILLSLGVLLVTFLFSRILGLSIDGWEQAGMVAELVFELCFLLWVLLLFTFQQVFLNRRGC